MPGVYVGPSATAPCCGDMVAVFLSLGIAHTRSKQPTACCTPYTMQDDLIFLEELTTVAR